MPVVGGTLQDHSERGCSALRSQAPSRPPLKDRRRAALAATTTRQPHSASPARLPMAPAPACRVVVDGQLRLRRAFDGRRRPDYHVRAQLPTVWDTHERTHALTKPDSPSATKASDPHCTQLRPSPLTVTIPCRSLSRICCLTMLAIIPSRAPNMQAGGCVRCDLGPRPASHCRPHRNKRARLDRRRHPSAPRHCDAWSRPNATRPTRPAASRVDRSRWELTQPTHPTLTRTLTLTSRVPRPRCATPLPLDTQGQRGSCYTTHTDYAHGAASQVQVGAVRCHPTSWLSSTAGRPTKRPSSGANGPSTTRQPRQRRSELQAVRLGCLSMSSRREREGGIERES